MGRLDGKIALISGAASGIGEACARVFAREGATVWVADVAAARGEAVADAIGGSFIRLDVTDEASWAAATDAALARHGRLDVLVNSAGVVGDVVNGVVDRLPFADWRRVMAINLDGTFLGCQAALRAMAGRREGAIVNISSVGAYYPTQQNAAYGSSKAAVMQLAKSVAAFGAEDGGRIRCNSVHPGQIATPMLHQIREEFIERAGPDGAAPIRAAIKASIDRMPLGEGEPVDVAHLVAFLASDEARYITGGEFTVDGGWRLLR